MLERNFLVILLNSTYNAVIKYILYLQLGSLRPGPYAVDDIVGNGIHPEPSLRVTTGGSIQGHPSSLDDPSLFNQRQDVSIRISPSVPADRSSERTGYLGNNDGSPDTKGESNVLFVDGLPTDCTRREVGRILFLCQMFFPVCGYFSFVMYFRLLFCWSVLAWK